MAARTMVAAGGFASSTTTWGAAVPTASDSIVCSTAATLYVDTDLTPTALTLNAALTLIPTNGNVTFTVPAGVGNTFTGALIIKGSPRNVENTLGGTAASTSTSAKASQGIGGV